MKLIKPSILFSLILTSLSTVALPPPSSIITGPSNPVLETRFSATELEKTLRENTPELLSVAGKPKCGVSIYSLHYQTVDGSKHKTEASTAVMIPSGGEQCQMRKRIVLYAHGTSVNKNYDMTNMEINTGERSEGIAAIAFFASQGFIVISPNYAGYNGSTLDYHPYLNADQQANDMFDGLQAAYTHFPDQIPHGTGIFITGYSQGAYVALATQRRLESSHSGLNVDAVAAGSGPYSLSLLVDNAFNGAPGTMAPVFINLIATSWQKAYGNIYSYPAELYSTQYSQHAEKLLPSTITLDTLYKQMKLPERVVFQSGSLPGPVSTPPETGRVANAGFAQKNYYLNTLYRNRITHDISENPCNAASGEFISSCKPTTGLRQDAVINDLRSFTPAAPVFFCGTHTDTTVNYVSTTAMIHYLTQQGAAARTHVIDLAAAHPTNLAQALYQAEVKQNEKDAGNNAGKRLKLDNELHEIAAPYCMLLAREFFIKNMH